MNCTDCGKQVDTDKELGSFALSESKLPGDFMCDDCLNNFLDELDGVIGGE